MIPRSLGAVAVRAREPEFESPSPTGGSGNCTVPSGQSEPGPAWATLRPSSGSPASPGPGEPPSPRSKAETAGRSVWS